MVYVCVIWVLLLESGRLSLMIDCVFMPSVERLQPAADSRLKGLSFLLQKEPIVV